MMNCKEATRAIEKKAEGKLSFWQRVQLNFHLVMCKPCWRFKAHWNIISLFLEKTPAKHKLSNSDKNLILNKIDDEI